METTFRISLWRARLALHQSAYVTYDFSRFNAYAQALLPGATDYYQFSYPPFVLLLTAPLGVLPLWWGYAVWTLGGWALFAAAIHRIAGKGWLLYALAAPALFPNLIAGQNGGWIAGATGFGLSFLRSKPYLAGAMLSIACCKPQLSFLVPLALAAGCEWRALIGFVAGATTLISISAAAYGPGIFLAFFSHASHMKYVLLEDGTGMWQRMASILVLFRHVGFGPPAAYAAQLVFTTAVASGLVYAWHTAKRNLSDARCAALVLAMILGAPYVFDYDMMLAALAPAWLLKHNSGISLRWAILCALLAPLFAASLAHATGLAAGGMLLLPLFCSAVVMCRGSALEPGGSEVCKLRADREARA